MIREAKADKILLLGIDGMDPRLTRKYVNEGKMPNVKKLIERGSCREDLTLLGAQPTVTPSQWTTLATGAYPMTHGITCFFRQDPENMDTMLYNLDSRLCKAEPLWNSFAEAGKKTCVFHWPGCAWPPTSDSENLFVVDGSVPGTVGMGNCTREAEFILVARESIPELTIMPKAATTAIAPCVIEDLNVASDAVGFDAAGSDLMKSRVLLKGEDDGQRAYTGAPLDVVKSPIKMATGWENAPKDAKEFTLLLSGGLLRRPCLIVKNEAGIYDTVMIFKTKKEKEPLTVLKTGVIKGRNIDQCIAKDITYMVNRNYEVFELSEDGSQLKLYISAAMDINNDETWHPKELHKEIIEAVGPLCPTSQIGGQDPVFINDLMLNNWYLAADWQADAIHYLIENKGVEVVFSHFHSVDIEEHIFIRYMSANETKDGHWKAKIPPEMYQKFMEDLYIQADYYIGKFMHLLDEGWLITLVSDHAQVCPKHTPPFIGDMVGCNIRLMEQLGYTYLKRDENGNELDEIDYSRTRAVATRGCHIYINTKGKWPHGIVEPEDQYELEEQIMTDLYGYKDPKTGHRVIQMALRNRDAVLLGLGGPDSGDIVYWTAEGYNFDHCDGLSTAYGDADTSLSPIFIAAGPGVKQGFYTDRYIRQVDFAPTIAVLGGVRIPAQCEGAPAYQILEGFKSTYRE